MRPWVMVWCIAGVRSGTNAPVERGPPDKHVAAWAWRLTIILTITAPMIITTLNFLAKGTAFTMQP